MELQPVIPFEPVKTEAMPIGKQWIAQVKWDGVRMLTYYDGNTVKLFNRKLNERTKQYPEFTEIRRYCSADSVVLDGEVIALCEGKPSFHEIMRRDGIRNSARVDWAKRTIPAVYMIFDLLYYNSLWVVDRPLNERQQLLKEIIRPKSDVQLVENFPDGVRLFKAIRAENMEGIVYKDLQSTYIIDGKDNRWQKYKNYSDINAVIGGVIYQGETSIKSVMLGLYDEQKRFCYIGNAGSGKFTLAEWEQLTRTLKTMYITECPFWEGLKQSQTTAWVKPLITVKVQFMEWTNGGTLRQPSIQAIVEVHPETCVFE